MTKMKKTGWLVGGSALALLAVLAITFLGSGEPAMAGEAYVYKDPSCGCCEGYASYLEAHGYKVKVIAVDDMASVKARYGIPHDMESCHTTVFDGYAVEGHVPIEAVQRMLSERPAIDGIALPRMPAGSPGMPGTKRGPFTVYALSGGESSEYMQV